MFEKIHACKLCFKLLGEVEFYGRINKCGNKYLSSYCKPCERARSRDLKKKKWNDPVAGESLRNKAKTRTSTEEYKTARAQEQRKRYISDPLFRESKIEAVHNYNNSLDGSIKKKARSAFYYQENKEIIQAKLKKAQELNPKLRIRGFMRSRISETLKAYGSSKDGVSSFLHLPYTKEDLISHLSASFEPWMNFKNYGSSTTPNTSWQVDHIIPQSFFPYDSMDSDLFRWCWDLKNLRPLCSVKNAGEGNRKDLLGEPRDIRDLIIELSDITSFMNLKESIKEVVEVLQAVKPVEAVCPMGMIGLNYLDSVFAHRFSASTSGFISLVEALKDPTKILDSIRYLIRKYMTVNRANLYSVMRYSCRTPGHFFPAAAASIYKRYADSSSCVHDPFLGWGGRSLAAMSVGVKRFTGTDLQQETIVGCNQLFQAVSPFTSSKCEFRQSDAISHLRETDEKYDLIFTSPPYKDTENYNVSSNSMSDMWMDSFIIPICEQFGRVLNDKGKVALHLKDVNGAPTLTAYHGAMLASGFRQVARHKYGRTWVQSIYVYEKR